MTVQEFRSLAYGPQQGPVDRDQVGTKTMRDWDSVIEGEFRYAVATAGTASIPMDLLGIERALLTIGEKVV